jgi:PTH1 family peptidyl-tRNA hydrolase
MLRRLKSLFGRDAAGEALPVPSLLVVGLGNPGPKYAPTRHNVGFRVAQALASRHDGVWHEDRELESMLCVVEIADRSVALIAPQTFVNRSGQSVVAALARWPALDPARDLIVVYDDLDLPPGRIRLRPSGGPGGHNGIGDILARLDSKEVPRLRFGVGHPGASGAVIDWVLGAFSDEEEQRILPDAIDWAAQAVEAAIAEGVRSAMGSFNADRVNKPDPALTP